MGMAQNSIMVIDLLDPNRNETLQQLDSAKDNYEIVTVINMKSKESLNPKARAKPVQQQLIFACSKKKGTTENKISVFERFDGVPSQAQNKNPT